MWGGGSSPSLGLPPPRGSPPSPPSPSPTLNSQPDLQREVGFCQSEGASCLEEEASTCQCCLHSLLSMTIFHCGPKVSKSFFPPLPPSSPPPLDLPQGGVRRGVISTHTGGGGSSWGTGQALILFLDLFFLGQVLVDCLNKTSQNPCNFSGGDTPRPPPPQGTPLPLFSR